MEPHQVQFEVTPSLELWVCLTGEDAAYAQARGVLSPEVFGGKFVPFERTQEAAVRKAIFFVKKQLLPYKLLQSRSSGSAWRCTFRRSTSPATSRPASCTGREVCAACNGGRLCASTQRRSPTPRHGKVPQVALPPSALEGPDTTSRCLL